MEIAVYIVEDNAQNRDMLAGWISRAPGFRLAGHCGEAESALRLVPESKPDVVLMDINLPGMNGVEAVRRLKPMLPDTQFVMLTVYQDADKIYNALAAGATGYLLKQTPPAELLAAVEEVHRGGSPMTSTIARKVVQSFRQGLESGLTDEALSSREEEILVLLARGCFFKDVSAQLGISITTLKTHIQRIYEKLHVHSRTQAVAKYSHLAPLSPET
jgi:DNA-binding NarL/FixJ family response regulator